MSYNRPTSFSQNNLFEQCPRTWYMKYVQKIPGIDDLKYAHRGNVVHHCLEKYYPDKTMDISKVKELFEKEWKYFKLSETTLASKKDETWSMILAGIELDLNVTSVELKIFYPDVVAYIDVLDTKNGVITDWKTSTISEKNKIEYIKQVKYYSWLYYRKFNKLPTLSEVKYLKYTGTKSELSCVPTMKDIDDSKKWHEDVREKMSYYIDNPGKIPPFNQSYYFCPYKHLWNIDERADNINSYLIDVYGGCFYVKGVDKFLSNHFYNKYCFEKPGAKFMKDRYPNANTTTRLWSNMIKRLPIGFLDEVKKSLHDYSIWKKKVPVIKINDRRTINNTVVEMPDKLLSGKILRPYQNDAVNIFVSRNKLGAEEIATGGGKTIIATEIIRKLSCVSLFLVDRKELLEQTVKVLEDNLGIPIGVVGAGKKEIQNVTVAMVQTLNKNVSEYASYLSSVKLFICDENHKSAANSYFDIGKFLVNTEYRLGLTATNYRDDGSKMMLQATMGNTIFKIDVQELIKLGYLVKPDIVFIKSEMSQEKINELIDSSSKGLINEIPRYDMYYPNFIVKNEERNLLVKKLASKHKEDTVLILVKHIEHGKFLEELIPGSIYIHGAVNKKIRTDSLEDFKNGKLKVLISTISIFAEGIDIPILSVIINASANRGAVKSIQILGRGIRTYKGKTTCRFYDFLDKGTFFYKASEDRIKAFRGQGHNVRYITNDDI